MVFKVVTCEFWHLLRAFSGTDMAQRSAVIRRRHHYELLFVAKVENCTLWLCLPHDKSTSHFSHLGLSKLLSAGFFFFLLPHHSSIFSAQFLLPLRHFSEALLIIRCVFSPGKYQNQNRTSVFVNWDQTCLFLGRKWEVEAAELGPGRRDFSGETNSRDKSGKKCPSPRRCLGGRRWSISSQKSLFCLLDSGKLKSKEDRRTKKMIHKKLKIFRGKKVKKNDLKFWFQNVWILYLCGAKRGFKKLF